MTTTNQSPDVSDCWGFFCYCLPVSVVEYVVFSLYPLSHATTIFDDEVITMTDKERKELKEQLSEKLKGYSAVSKLARVAGAGVIGGTALAAPLFLDMPVPVMLSDAAATIVSGTINTTFTAPFANFPIDIDGYGPDFGIRLGVPSAQIGYGGSFFNTFAGGYLKNFSLGATITGALNNGAIISVGSNSQGQNWPLGGYMGFQLASGNKGWLQLELNKATRQIKLGAFAYEDSGGPIKAGETGAPPIPEPGTLATLALGAAGLYAWRKHRQKQAEKAQQDAEKDS